MGYLISLLHGIIMWQEYITILGYSVKVVHGEVNMLEVESVIWVIYLALIKDLDMEILMIHSMESIEDRTAHWNIYGLFDGMSLVWKDWTVLGSSSGASVSLSKGSKYGNLDVSVNGEVNVLVILVLYFVVMKYL